MRKLGSKLSILALVLVAALAMAPMASANSVTTLTQGPYSAVLTVGTGTATLTLSCSTCGTGNVPAFFVNAIAIQLGGNAITVTSGSASSGSWTFQNGQNAVQCGGTGNWGCAITSPAVAGNGLTLTFNFNGAASGTSFSVQFDVCSTSATALNNQGNQGCVKGRGGNFVTNFSQSGTPVNTPPTVPEPGTLGLLGTGLVGIAGLVRRRMMS